MIKPIKILVKICVIKEARAAPLIPNNGIKLKFNTIFIKAPDKLMTHKYLCLFSAKIQIFRTEPKYENVVYHTIIRKAEIAE